MVHLGYSQRKSPFNELYRFIVCFIITGESFAAFNHSQSITVATVDEARFIHSNQYFRTVQLVRTLYRGWMNKNILEMMVKKITMNSYRLNVKIYKIWIIQTENNEYFK